jgi:hypothetical protein
LAIPAPVPAAARPRRVNSGTLAGTLNWSGYAETGTGFTAVKTTYRVPTVTPSSALVGSADWAGIGGINGDTTLVQAGTSGYTENGVVAYVAWTEILPAPAVNLPLTINPGDVIKVKIRELSTNRWSLKVVDVTTGAKGGRTVSYTSSHASAEVIHERPVVCNPSCGLLELTQTTNPVFDPGSYSTAPAGSAPSFVPLLQPETGGTLFDVVMVNDTQTALIATPSDADTDNDGFQVQDGSAIPPPPPS